MGGWRPAAGIAADVAARLPYYRHDWTDGCSWGLHVLAPATYIFFASALPALAFGQQLAMETDGRLTVVHVLLSTALSGLVQSIFGGQPLLIIGVAEPLVLIYGFMYAFAKSTPGLGPALFLPWAAWVCIWTALMCLTLALAGACDGIHRFTRFSGELFGALIAILFLQVGIKGMVTEFYAADQQPAAAPAVADQAPLLLVNGLWGLLLSLGLLLTSLRALRARDWLLGRAWLRGFIADYGVPLLVVAWSGVSFAVTPAEGVPRRVATPNTWQVTDSWSVAAKLGLVPGPYIAAALLPAFIISVLFFFDHNVSSQLAQQPEFNLVKPASYHWDFLLLSGLTLGCGLLGIPPVNGVLPQAPMHTRSLAHIRKRALEPHLVAAVPGAAAAPAPAAAAATAAAAAAVAATAVCVTQQHPKGGSSAISNGPGALHGVAELVAAAAGPPDGGGCSSPHSPQAHRTSGELRHRGQQQLQASRQEGECSRPALQPQHRMPEQLQLAQHQQQPLTPRAAVAAAALVPGPAGLNAGGSGVALNALPDSAAGATAAGSAGAGGVVAGPSQQHEPLGYCLNLEVREQRLTNLLQSLLVGVCLGITPAIQCIPTAVLWGYFVFMSVESLAGSQLWERVLLMLTDPKKRVAVVQQEHTAYLQLVPFRVVVRFTLMQLLYLLGVWALTTWAGIAATAFPLPIMLLVPIRQYVLPRLFKRQHLAALDAASYEEAPAIPDRLQAAQELYAVGAIPQAPGPALPVGSPPGLGSPAPGAPAGYGDGDDEGEVLSHEFRGWQLKHHLRPEELQHQRQQ